MKYLIGIIFITALGSCSKSDDTISADVNYTDLQPDVVVTDSFLMDINKDGVTDIVFRIEKDFQGYSSTGESTYNYFARCVSKNSSTTLSAGTRISSTQNTWNCLQFGSFISSESTWVQKLTLGASVIGAGKVGLWETNSSYDFIGVKIGNNSKSNYGWVRLITNFDTTNVETGYNFTIGEFAYMIPNNIVIKAGQIE